MPFNPIMVFNKTKATIRNALDEPNVVLAGGIFVLGAILFLILGILVGIPLDIIVFAKGLISDLVLWIVGAAILYILLYMFRGKDAQGKFTGILTALSLNKLVLIFAALIFFTGLFIVTPDGLSLINKPDLTMEELAIFSTEGLELNAVSYLIGAIFGILLVILTLLSVYVQYHIVSQVGESNFTTNWLILILYFAIINALRLFIVF